MTQSTKNIANFRILPLCFVIVLLITAAIYADDAGQMFQAGLFAEHGTGDLDEAIKSYEGALLNVYGDEKLAAKTLFRLGICYEKIGRDKDAKKAYQRIISHFSGQKVLSDKAAERLEKLSSGLTSNGCWFLYKGEHIYLIGGGTASIYAGSGLKSGEPVTGDPVQEWKLYIDLLAQNGVNFVRFYPWDFLTRSEVPEYACPWAVTSDKPTYDLGSFNPSYWAKLGKIVSYANAKDIIFEIVIFDDDSPWDRHPFNEKCGGVLKDREHYYDLRNSKNVEYQESYVEKTIAETVEFSNVIYEVCGAVGWAGKPLTADMKNWVSHWIDFVDKRIPDSSRHLITISQHSWSSGGELDKLWDLSGVDVISAQETEGAAFALGKEYTHKNFLNYWRSGYGKPIMMNEVSFGDMRSHPDGGTKGWVEERQHLWVAFTSGGHAARTDFQPFLDTYPSLDSCLHLANFVRGVRFWEMSPLVDFILACDGTCYGLGSASEFVAYIRTGGRADGGKMRLKLPDGNYSAKWYDPVNGVFLPNSEVVKGGVVNLNLPETNEIVLYISKANN